MIEETATHNNLHQVNPGLNELLRSLKMDKVFGRAQGDLIYSEGEVENEYLDFIGGYGANLLGHNHPALVETMTKALADQIPVHAQLSVRSKSATLASVLNKEMREPTGRSFVVMPVNSGTEAIELSLKHCLMTFNKRLHNFWERFEKRMSNIRSIISRSETPRLLAFDQDTFDNFDSFYSHISSLNERLIEKCSPLFLSAKKAFHGKTLGSLALTHRLKFRKAFGEQGPRVVFFENDLAHIEREMEKAQLPLLLPTINKSTGEISMKEETISTVAGLFLEPIQGEGGVHVLDGDFLRGVRDLTNRYRIPFVLDEIQCGFFRTGEFLASTHSGITGDLYTLGKSLGGSLVKIGAVLISEDLYDRDLGLLHSSTFAQDDLSSIVAVRAYGLAKEQSASIVEKGTYFMYQLQQLQRRYPNVIEEVRGKGLMLGVQFKKMEDKDSYLIRSLYMAGYLGYVLSAYLLNNHRIRVGITLSSDMTMRIQPSMNVTQVAMDKFIIALENLVNILDHEDYYQLIQFLLPEKARGLRKRPKRFHHDRILRISPTPEIPKVGFLCHCIDTDTFKAADPSLSVLDEDTIEQLLLKFLPVCEPTTLGETYVQSQNGDRVHLTMVGLPLTSRMCKEALKERKTDELVSICNRAVEYLKKEHQVSTVGLGQYTSIITNNGKNIVVPGVGVTTGNSLTTYMGLEAVCTQAEEKGLRLSEETVAVIGAAGNICSIYATYLANHTERLVLVGSNSLLGYRRARNTARFIYEWLFRDLMRRAEPPAEGLGRALSNTELFMSLQRNPAMIDDKKFDILNAIEHELGDASPIVVVKDLDIVKNCRVVVVATNADKPFLEPHHFSQDTIVCDLSVPTSCTEALIHNNKNIDVLLGGLVKLPKGEKIPAKGFSLQTGSAFACLSETLLLGLERWDGHYSYGAVSYQQVQDIGSTAAKHGFKMLAAKSMATL